MSEDIGAPQRNSRGQFVAGHIGLGGRPRGSRNKLSERFLAALTSDFEEHGLDAIREMRVTSPSNYCRLVGMLVQREAPDVPDEYEDMSPAQLRAMIIEALSSASELSAADWKIPSDG